MVSETDERTRFEFLCRLYELSEANSESAFDVGEVGAELGMTPAEARGVAEWLEENYLISFVEYSDKMATVRINESGLAEVEEALLSPYLEAECFPPAHTMYIDSSSPLRRGGEMLNSDRWTSSVFGRLAERFVLGQIEMRGYDEDDAIPIKSLEDLLEELKEPECERLGYRCRDRIGITGIVTKGRNSITANYRPLNLGDAPLILLLRLAVELKRGEGGWVSRQSLASEGIVADSESFQPYTNLRNVLAGALRDGGESDLIENDGLKNYRLSTHPDFVTCDKEKLLLHPSHRVRELAKRLP